MRCQKWIVPVDLHLRTIAGSAMSSAEATLDDVAPPSIAIFYLLRIGCPLEIAAKLDVRIGQRCSSAAYEPVLRGSYPLS
jgi:hypothetical protein